MENQEKVKEYLESKCFIQELQSCKKYLSTLGNDIIYNMVFKCIDDKERVDKGIRLPEIFFDLFLLKNRIMKGETYA